MEKILNYSHKKISGVSTKFKRYLYTEVEGNTNRIIGVVGLRGIGKTTLLLQIAKERKDAVYFSMDSTFIRGRTIFDIVENLNQDYGIKNFYIDEIHKYKNWQQDLKTVYDFFDDVNVIFSGSSSIDLIKGNYDLSRRGKLFKLEKFSFREYLSFKHKINIVKLTFEELIENFSEISYKIYGENEDILKLFKEYIKIGELGFGLENNKKDYEEKLGNILNKIIYEDISSFYNLKTENLSHFFDILKFISNSSPSKISYSSIAKTLKITDATVKLYIDILTEIGFLNSMGKEGKIGINLRKSKKIYFELVNFLWVFSDEINVTNTIGILRESILAGDLTKIGRIFYPDSGDIVFIKDDKKYTFEVGGKNKTLKQIKSINNYFIVSDDINFGEKTKIPLWLFGMLN